jgi:hypothetical protein
MSIELPQPLTLKLAQTLIGKTISYGYLGELNQSHGNVMQILRVADRGPLPKPYVDGTDRKIRLGVFDASATHIIHYSADNGQTWSTTLKDYVSAPYCKYGAFYVPAFYSKSPTQRNQWAVERGFISNPHFNKDTGMWHADCTGLNKKIASQHEYGLLDGVVFDVSRLASWSREPELGLASHVAENGVKLLSKTELGAEWPYLYKGAFCRGSGAEMIYVEAVL